VKLDRNQITPWAFMTAGPAFRCKDFYGREIAYQGIKFEGSPRQVFWGRYIEPFLEDLVHRVVEETLRLASARMQNAQQPLAEAGGMLKSVAHRAYRRMADIDQRLRGEGFPNSVPKRSVDGELARMERLIDQRIQAECAMAAPEPRGPAGGAMARTKVFISYAHKDDRWRERVVEQLGVLTKQGLLDLWDDRKIGAGDAWFDQIHEHMLSAKVALLLISSSFLTSDFILAHEVPKLFDRYKESGMHIYPLLIRPCAWQEVAWLARMQMRPPEAKALSSYRRAKIEELLASVAREVAGLCKSTGY
jgi:TIR domain